MKNFNAFISKSVLVIMLAVPFLNNVYAQIGINTVNPLAKFHVDGAKDNPNTGTPNITQESNDIVVTNAGRVGIGTINPVVRLDLRSGTSDNNAMGIDYTPMAANTAGAGALRYLDTSGGRIQVSDGTNWTDLYSTPTKSFVIARINAANASRTFTYDTVKDVIGWEKTHDPTTSFDPSAGVFTAPRNGIYNVSFSYDFVHGAILAAGSVESQIVKKKNGTVTGEVKCLRTFGKSTRAAQAGGSCTTSIALDEGETLQVRLLQKIDNTTSGGRGLRSDNTAVTNGFFGFNNLTVVEQ